MLETSFWGTNVHLWYLARTIGFAIFLSSVWWTMLRFVGGWLSGILTVAIALLSLWADVWSRLGPSEAYGAACLGIMLFAADAVLFSQKPWTRTIGAVVLTLATIALIGMKETFLPLIAVPACVFVLAGADRRLSLLLFGVLSLLILASAAGMVVVMSRQVAASGTDFYANSVGIWPVLKFGIPRAPRWCSREPGGSMFFPSCSSRC